MKSFSLDEQTLQSRTSTAVEKIDAVSGSLRRANKELQKAIEEINKHDELYRMNTNYYESKLETLDKWKSKYNYFGCAGSLYNTEVDSNFYKEQEGVLEALSSLHSEDFKVDNTIGITKTNKTYVTTVNGPEVLEQTYQKDEISFDDILKYGYFGDQMKIQYQQYKEAVESETGEVSDITYDKFIESIVTQGEFTYEVGWKASVSLAIDMIPIVGDAKGIIEGLTGVDWITGRKLSGLERGLSMLSAIPLVGDGMMLAKVGTKTLIKEGLKATAEFGTKFFVKELGQNVLSMAGAQAFTQVTGMNPMLAMLFYQGSRMGLRGLDTVGNFMKDKDLFMKMELKKNEFKNVLKSKGVAIENVIKNVTEVDGKVKVKVKDKLGQLTEIVFRSEELTPYQRFVCFEGCFTEDTLVKTIDGDKKISQIKDGDLVLAKHHYTGEIDYRKAELIEKLAEEIVEIRVCGQTIEATPSHLFKTDKGWVAAKDLEIGNNVELQNNGYAVVENVNKKNYNKNKVYNLEVEEYHTFYITELGILVHNDYKDYKLNYIYEKFTNGIKDDSIRQAFKNKLDELDELDLSDVNNRNRVDAFHDSFNGVNELDIDKIRSIINFDTITSTKNKPITELGLKYSEESELLIKKIEMDNLPKDISYKELCKEYELQFTREDIGYAYYKHTGKMDKLEKINYQRILEDDGRPVKAGDHAHHICYKKGAKGEISQKCIEGGNKLKSVGIDPVTSPENLIGAPNKGHSKVNINEVVAELNKAEKTGLDMCKDIVSAEEMDIIKSKIKQGIYIDNDEVREILEDLYIEALDKLGDIAANR